MNTLGLCGKAISLPKPDYPPEAKAQKISGAVHISVVVDEEGNVIWAKGIEGAPLLQEAALRAACQSRFSPEKISGRPIKVNRVISYNFLNE
jgi:protein TonB